MGDRAYEVAGTHYQGRRLSFADSRPDESYNTWAGAKAATNFFFPGMHIKVYYEPGHPGNSALRTGISRSPEELVAIAGFVIAYGLYSWFRERRSLVRAESANVN